MQVDAIEQWTTESRQVASPLQFGAPAGSHGVTEITTVARVHRSNDQWPCRKCGFCAGAGDLYGAIFQGLAQRFQGRAAELSQFVQKQHAVMSQALLTGSRDFPAADQSSLTHRVMWSSKWTSRADPCVGVDQPCDTVNGRQLQCLFELEGRQYARQRPSQQRLATSRRAHEEQIVAPRGCDFQRASRRGLTT